jgi:hypothetical protein
MGGVNEQFGALGLGSSSARTAELGRQAQNLAQSVGEQGILSGVAAEEAARQRQLGAFSPFQQAQQQQIGAQQAAGGLFGTAGGLQQGAGGLQQGAGNLQLGAGQLNLNQQLQPAQAQTNLAQGLIPVQAGQMNRAPQGAAPGTNFAAPTPFGGGASPRGFVGGGGGGMAPFQQQKGIGALSTQRGGTVPEGRGFEGGGRGDFGDVLSNLLFGQQFNRDFAAAAPAPIPIPQIQPAMAAAAPASRTIPGMQMPFNTGLLKSAGPTTNQSAAASQDLLNIIRGIGLAGEPDVFGKADPFFKTGTAFQRGMIGAPSLLSNPIVRKTAAGKGLTEKGGKIPKAECGGKVEKGGEVQGPKHPPDQVPILATGGEVVLDPPTVAMLEAFDGSPEMAMQIVQQVIEVSQRSPEMVGKQFGGPIPTAGSSVANPPGGTVSFLQGLDPVAPPDPGQMAIQQAQEARRRADLFRQAAFNSPRGAQINQMAEEAEAAAQLAEQAVTQMAVAATPRKTELEQTTIQKGKEEEVTEERGLTPQEEKEIRQRAQGFVENGQAATFEEGLSLAHREVQQSREPERAAQLAEIAGGSQQVQDALNEMDALEQSGSDIGSIIVGFQTLMAMGIPDETLEALFPKSMQMLESQVRKNK